MLSRKKVYDVIDRERNYQDAEYNPDAKTSSGLTRRERDQEVIVGIAMLREYVNKASDVWVGTKGSQFPAIQQVAKIAAIAVRVLERAGGSEELLTKGLR
jgi:hypothetical protein